MRNIHSLFNHHVLPSKLRGHRHKWMNRIGSPFSVSDRTATAWFTTLSWRSYEAKGEHRKTANTEKLKKELFELVEELQFAFISQYLLPSKEERGKPYKGIRTSIIPFWGTSSWQGSYCPHMQALETARARGSRGSQKLWRHRHLTRSFHLVRCHLMISKVPQQTVNNYLVSHGFQCSKYSTGHSQKKKSL